jgi:hypothetical protein
MSMPVTMSRTVPMTVTSGYSGISSTGRPFERSILMVLPIGLSPGQNAFAVDALTMATRAADRASSVRKARPSAIGSPRTGKNSGETNVQRVRTDAAAPVGAAATIRAALNSGLPLVTATDCTLGSVANASAHGRASSSCSPRTLIEVRAAATCSSRRSVP